MLLLDGNSPNVATLPQMSLDFYFSFCLMFDSTFGQLLLEHHLCVKQHDHQQQCDIMSYTMTYAVFLQHVDAEEQGSLLGLMSNSPLL